VGASEFRPPLRISHVITRLIVGGAQENTVASVLGLRQRPGLQLQLLSGPTVGPEGSLEHEFARAPGLLILLPHLVRPIDPWKDARALGALVAWFRRLAPHVVHTHSGKAGLLGRLAARRAGVPIIVHTIHGPSFGPFQGALANYAFRSAERFAARFTTHFVVVAEAMTRQYLAAGVGQAGQFTCIRSGFEMEPFLAAKNDPVVRARWGLAPTDFVVGKIARFFKLKGHEDLFVMAPELAKRCPRVKFLLVGDGPWLARFKARARAAGLERHTVFAGLVPPREIPVLIGVMDVLAHLSQREGLARALPQALAASRPVVAYDCDGAGEVCRENETGFLVRPGDLTNLTSRLLQLAADSALRQRLGQRGQAMVREAFSVDRMVDELDALYARLAAARQTTS
jgi:glycosyltransferase involved in cell wall biosynthesis